MRIKLVEEVPVQVKTECLARGVWDRPGEPAFFVAGDLNEWVCLACVVAGEEHIRQGFAQQAERFRRAAEAFAEAAEGEIVINALQVQRAEAISRREREAWEAAQARARARGEAPGEGLPF